MYAAYKFLAVSTLNCTVVNVCVCISYFSLCLGHFSSLFICFEMSVYCLNIECTRIHVFDCAERDECACLKPMYNGALIRLEMLLIIITIRVCSRLYWSFGIFDVHHHFAQYVLIIEIIVYLLLLFRMQNSYLAIALKLQSTCDWFFLRMFFFSFFSKTINILVAPFLIRRDCVVFC